MKKYTFRGGIHPPEHKELTEHKPIVKLDAPKMVILPLRQHIGATLEPLVKVGEHVYMGQKIADSDQFVSAPVHSSVSGKVMKIEEYFHPSGMKAPAIFIENDGKDELDPSVKPIGDYRKLSPPDIAKTARQAGLVGMGGAGFPTHIKLMPPKDKKVEYLIINGAECEPYLTSDHRVMLEEGEEVLYGLKVMMHNFGVDKAYLAIEENKMDAAEHMQKLLNGDNSIEVCVLKTKYPQGSEKHLIKAVSGREVPSGKLPIDAGAVVNNIDTCTALARVMKTGMPLIRRIVTVSGLGVKKPCNFEVRIGTDFQTLFDAAGGLKEDVKKVIMGGPMMGIAQYDLRTPVVKGTSGLLALLENEVIWEKEMPCTRCAKCVDGCPMGLMPLYLSAYSKKEDYDMMIKYHITDCIECGSCSYVCPSRKNPLQRIRIGKQLTMQRLREQKK